MDLAAAKILHERGQINDAVQAYNELLNKSFGDPAVLFYLGTALFQQGQYGLGASCLKAVIETKPKMQSAYQNLGNCFKLALDYKGAEEVYRMGMKLGDDSQLFCCMGSLNINVGSPEKALEWYKLGLKLDPHNDIIKYNIGLAQLEMGQWDEGFKNYNLGFAGGNRPARSYAHLPEWDGSPDKTVIVWGEQGIGDEIMFASILPDMMKISKRVIFDCHPRLVKTMERSFGIECHGTRKNHHLEWLPGSDAEAHVCITTLANYFRKKDEDFPGTPYLIPETWTANSGKMRVGISWAGGTSGTRADLRSIQLEKFLPILEQDCDFYSLQYTDQAAREVCDLEEKTGVHIKHYPNMVEKYDYDTTVNFAATMDLVITVCTSIYHVAGALGVPVWCLTPSGPAWRYLTKGETSHWYNSAKLFRQAKGEEWETVIKRVSNELNQRLLQSPK